MFGWYPKREDIAIGSRHLGLKMAYENGSMTEFGPVIEEFCDLDALFVCAEQPAKVISNKKAERSGTGEKKQVSIGVAWDNAFCFYYQDNLDRLRDNGADIVFFSPLTDPLPGVDALYFGGGYPELHLSALESSQSTKKLKSIVDAGIPLYAECGGLLYLTREIIADRTYRLCEVFRPMQK